MTRHLNDAERIDALEGTLTPGRLSHLDECAACREEVAAMRSVWADVTTQGSGEVPEPSPLFWEHFQGRVAAAVDDVAAVPVPWWRGSARAWLSLGAAAAVVLVAVAVLPWRPAPAGGVPDEVAAVVDVVETDAPPLDVEWQFVTDVLGTLEPETAQTVLGPSAQAVDAAFGMLTAAERDEFARLLQAELAEGSE